MKKFIAALLAGLTLFTLVGCSGGSKADSSTPKDYSQIIHFSPCIIRKEASCCS